MVSHNSSSFLKIKGDSVCCLPDQEISRFDIRCEENNEVLVRIVEVSCFHLVEIVLEARFAVVLRIDISVEIVYTESISVKQNSENLVASDLMIVRSIDCDLASVCEAVVSASSLPVRNFLIVRKSCELIMESA